MNFSSPNSSRISDALFLQRMVTSFEDASAHEDPQAVQPHQAIICRVDGANKR